MIIYNQIPVLKNTAIALGCFDGIHIGHQAVIDALHSRQADRLDKAVFSFSDNLSFKKGAEHIASFEDKCEILSERGIGELIAKGLTLEGIVGDGVAIAEPAGVNTLDDEV